jgi:hypothetical protein
MQWLTTNYWRIKYYQDLPVTKASFSRLNGVLAIDGVLPDTLLLIPEAILKQIVDDDEVHNAVAPYHLVPVFYDSSGLYLYVSH